MKNFRRTRVQITSGRLYCIFSVEFESILNNNCYKKFLRFIRWWIRHKSTIKNYKIVGLLGRRWTPGYYEYGVFHGIMIDKDVDWIGVCTFSHMRLNKILEDYKESIEDKYKFLLIKCIPVKKIKDKVVADPFVINNGIVKVLI